MMQNNGHRALQRAAALAGCLSALSCQKAPEKRPDLIAPCSGRSCLVNPAGGPSDGGDAAAVDGSAFSDAAAAKGPIVLTGRVLQFKDDRFADALPFTGQAQISAQAQVGGSVATQYDGTHDFSLPGVLAAPSVWVSATPNGGDAVPTLVAVPTAWVFDVSIPLVRLSALDLIFSVMALPTAFDANRGDIVAFVTSRDTDLPLPNISVTSLNAQTVAYAVSGTWTDTAATTGPLGLALLANVTAEKLPGSAVTVEFSGPGIGDAGVGPSDAGTGLGDASVGKCAVDIRVAAGAATVVSVKL